MEPKAPSITKARRLAKLYFVGLRIELRLKDPESLVLPLDDPTDQKTSAPIIMDSGLNMNTLAVIYSLSSSLMLATSRYSNKLG